MVGSDGKNPIQLTKDENTTKDDFPTWAPDGKKLAFASDQSGNFDVWAANADGSSKVQLTISAEAESKPAWSPDGLKMIYAKENGIYLKGLSAGDEVQLSNGAGDSNPAWSRDGTELVYNTAGGDIYAKKVYTGALTGVINQPILNQTVSGLVEIRGTALDTNLESYRIDYSPNAMPYFWVLIAQSNTPVNNGVLGAWNTASVSDGEYILRLIVNDKAGNSLQNTVIVNADNDNWKLTISGLTQLTSTAAWDVEPAWSPDSTKIAFSSNRSGNYDIWAMNADGTGLQNLTNDPAYDDKPVWSPDGTKIAIVSDRSGNKDIWVANADGSGTPQQLTDLTIIDTDQTWSPDGSKIAFASDRSGNFDIWITNSDGTGSPIKLTSSEADDREPAWSQFGIAFTSDRSGNKGIWMIEDINNPNPLRLTSSEAEDKEPCWAPIAIPLSDGSNRPLITFTSTRNGNQDIYVMDTDGIDQSKSLTDYTNTNCNPAWSPDGTKVAYASYKDGQYDIWAMTFGINTTALGVRPQQGAITLEVIDPKDGKKVETIRPAFEWYGIRGHARYRAVITQIGETDRNFDKTITSTEAYPDETKTKDPRPRSVYQIHEFDEGLSRGSWNWKVQALSADGSVLAESAGESFEITPDLTISGITNYPNPFNPNRERTKLRYRLSTDASEVKIRIYDITGSLVTELDGTTNGEASSVWDKYNDVGWDGRNGRGDVVMNGIYPFEITARLGDRSVSGRGKIAVLK
jgi:Tol biopolymer transport system component